MVEQQFDQDLEQQEYERGRNQKQAYLIQHIVDAGHDANLFAQHLDNKIENGVNIDNWTFEGLVDAVNEFVNKVTFPQEAENTVE